MKLKRMLAFTVLCMFCSFAHCGVVQSASKQLLWDGGVDGYHTYRIPAIATTTNGTLLAFCEGRVNSSSDTGDIDLIMKRSTDDGATWSTNIVIWSDGANTCGNPVPIVDQSNNKVVLLMTWNHGSDNHTTISAGTGNDTRRVYLCASTDDGLTWSSPTEITSSVKDPSWGWYATGPGGGIQLRDGDDAGRMIVGCDHTDSSAVFRSHAIYSDDGGSTWNLGGVVPGSGLNECQVVELSDGKVMINMRNYTRPPNARRVAVSTDSAESWNTPIYDTTLIEPICEGAVELVRPADDTFSGMIAFLNPADESVRSNLTVRLSFDNADSWIDSYVLEPGKSGYSDLAVDANGELIALYEAGTSTSYDEIYFSKISMDETTLLNYGASPVSENVVFEDGMQAWFNANDVDSIDNPVHAGRFRNWSAKGEAGVSVATADDVARPYYVANGFARADGSDAPMVRFNREVDGTLIGSSPHYLRSTTNNITFNITQQSTWFLSYRITYDNNQRSLFGLNIADGNRWGGFFLGQPNPPNRLRAHNSCSTGNLNMDLLKDVNYVMDSRRGAAGVDTSINGSFSKYTSTGLGTMPSAGSEFRIGGMLDGVSAHAIFDLAEILVYNRAVNDAERVIIHNAMASRSGMILDNMDVYAGGEGPLNGYHKGVTGIGNYTAPSHAVAGTVSTSSSSGGLVVEDRSNSLNSSGEFICLGFKGDKNGWLYDSDNNRKLYREWYIQKTTEDGVDAELTFDLSDAGILLESGLTYRLLYKNAGDAQFSSLSSSAVISGDQISFNVNDASLATGIYTLGVGGLWTDEKKNVLMSDSLAVFYRADQGILLSDPSVRSVCAWQSTQGLSTEVVAESDAAQPELVPNAFERASGIYEPAVRFNWTGSSTVADTPQVLKTKEETALGLKSNVTWFAVAQHPVINRDRGVFGLENSDSRFGVFFLGGDAGASASYLRPHAFFPWVASVGHIQATVPTGEPFLIDIRRDQHADGTAEVLSSLDGSVLRSETWPAADLPEPIPSKFMIGSQLSVIDNLVGDVAEVRVYDRALNDAEIAIVQNHLAARYGISLGGNDLYAGSTSSAGDYDLDVVGIGCELSDDIGRVPGAVDISDGSAGLMLLSVNDSLNLGGEYVLAGHRVETLVGDGWTNAVMGELYDTRWQRDWWISEHAADGVDVELVFDFALAGVSIPAGNNFVLLFREDLSDPFEVAPVDAMSLKGTTVRFSLLNSRVADGYYTLGLSDAAALDSRGTANAGAGVTPGLRAWFRGSDYLGVDSGSVTNWGNMGLIGDKLDVFSAGGDPAVNLQGVERANGVYEPSVVFDGSGRLVSTLTSDLNVDRNLIWFVVLKPTGTMANKGLFGADNSDNRFGGFFTGGTGNPLRCHAYNSNNSSYQRHLPVVPTSWQLADYQRVYSGSGYWISAFLNGVDEDHNHAAVQNAPGDYRFKIGDMLDDSSSITDFSGEIAELRVYSRALLDAERVIVQNHLAARYGISLAANGVYAGSSASNGESDIDVVGIGCVTNSVGYFAGTLSASESSGGLTLTESDASLDDGEFVLAGHSGVSNSWKYLGRGYGATYRWNREWYVDKTAVSGVDVSLIFDFSDAGVSMCAVETEAEYKLLWRVDVFSSYQDTGVSGVLDGDTLTFEMNDDDLSDGMYTVGALLPVNGTVIFLR